MKFITDLGEDLIVQETNDISFRKIPRYGYWQYDASKDSPQVKETSSDLAYLQKKFGPELDVLVVQEVK